MADLRVDVARVWLIPGCIFALMEPLQSNSVQNVLIACRIAVDKFATAYLNSDAFDARLSTACSALFRENSTKLCRLNATRYVWETDFRDTPDFS